MFSNHWLTAAAVALLPFAAMAQQNPIVKNPSAVNAQAAVFAYSSVFKDYRTVVDEPDSPEKVWRAANEEVREEGGHAAGMTMNPSAPEHAPPDTAVGASKSTDMPNKMKMQGRK